MTAWRMLRASALVELATLAVLLGNRALEHLDAVTSAVGPVHGLAYLTTFGAAVLLDGAPRAARWLALVPGVGGLLAIRAVVRARAGAHAAAPEAGRSGV